MKLLKKRACATFAVSICIVVFSLIPAFARAADNSMTTVTGLDPTQLLNSVSAEVSTERLTPLAIQTNRVIAIRHALGERTEFRFMFPIRDSLSINGIGSQGGVGDISAQYRYIFPSRVRLGQVVGLGVSLATGEPSFSSGETQIVPYYGLSYHLGKRLTAIVEARYSVTLVTKSGFVETHGLEISPHILAILSQRGTYSDFAADICEVRGGYHYTSSEATLRVGQVFARRFNLSFFYTTPLSNFTYRNIQQRAYGVTFGVINANRAQGH